MYEENLEVMHCLDENNFPLDRHSADTTINVYGKQLIEFCQIIIWKALICSLATICLL